ncbi:ABC transporter substrate-binding protein [Roseomonas marmotae]|uniref:ABC transporter substrate-binding protein n=1 Tax=Roseomonas marmotae TaxID=2768161 RepID=A0ABS3KHT3_9PROT|nr:ABC transporter substrate-binding protein [Roseomonas marmotae]MBO1077036.1 ABC transporter substrate-binding protein [Roseomonas marmotae]QTI78432.1 ABC transporter substrate-binding protein [Roseomonas marmotae]
MQQRRSLALMAGLAITALVAQAPGPAAAQGSTLRVGIQDDPDALDPATSGTYAGRFVFAALCDKLVDIGPDLSIVPQLAQSWEVAPDGRGITFTLRQGVTFHDGTPFDAEAVKFNIERMQTMPDSRRKAELSPVSGVEVIAPDKVRLVLKAPFAPLLSVLSDRAGMMVSPAAAAKPDFAANPVCAGPYRFAERRARDIIRLTKYQGHYDAARHGYDAVTYAFIPDTTVRLSRLRAGDLDVAERLAPTDLKTVREDRNLGLHTASGLGVSHLMINVGGTDRASAPIVKDARLRKALELALDRNVINRVAFGGENAPDNQMLPLSDPFRSTQHPMPARDVAAAKALLAQAGVTTVPVELTFENAPTDARVAQIIQSMAKEAGFDIKLVPLETTTAIQRYLAGNFEAYIGNWSGRGDPDGTLYAFFSCEGGQNVNKYCNRALQGVLDQARAETDTAKRKALYEQASGMYLADLPSIPLYHPNWFVGARANVTGITVYPDGLLRLTGVAPAR